MMSQGVFLIVEKGNPYPFHEVIPVTKNEVLLGRSWKGYDPEITFSSMYISRKHAVITNDNNQFYIADLMSMHGTEVNGNPINQLPYLLRDGDTITLAKGEAVLSFNNTLEQDLGKTSEFRIPPEIMMESTGLAVHPDRREVLVDGEPLYLSGKDIDLFMLLYQKVNQAVSYDEIKLKIWPERVTQTADIPDVGRDEVNALVYRLRKKLGKYGDRVVTVPRFGYMLDL
ncbi:FHA domain-containing protein [Brevibacillus ginsengisoli]|uniref:FHA domain-containing protein n=1 Tax=Brevibacillus ginsengisoli TaxID=363854 RepID=UPI003CE73497